MSTTRVEKYVVHKDPDAEGWFSKGRAMANIGCYVKFMSTDKEKDLKKRCLYGLSQGFFEGSANADGSLTYMNQKFDYRELLKAAGG